MAKTRRAYTGGAVSTTTSSNIAASGTTSFTVTAATGWPYGSDPFFVVVEPGTASEEKILVTRAGSGDTTINIASDARRGQDGTVAVSHSNGATVFPVFVALDADEANELASKWTTKGDLVSHGASTFERLGVGSNGQFLRADSAETSGLKWETFNNTLGSGAAVRTLGTFVGGDVLQAAELNGIGTYSDYTPTFTNISFSSYTARYTQVNKLVHVWFSGVLDSTVGGTIGITTPTNSKPTNADGVFVSLAHGRDATTGGRTPGQINIRSGNGLQFWTLAAGGSSLIWDATEPFTWASGDDFMFTLTYESD